MIVISDSTPLIYLAKVNRFSFLQLLFGEIIIPQSVYNEIVIFGEGRAGSHEVTISDWVKVEQAQDQEAVRRLRKKHEQLSQTDAETIILSKERQADFLLADDIELRRVAEEDLIGIKVLHTGTLLIFVKQEGFIDDVKSILDEMRQKGLWITESVYQQILRGAGESPD